jgi:hypothetical protein
VSENFIEASREKVKQLMERPLGELRLCAVLIDGTPFTCGSRQVCDRLETIFEQADPFVVHLGYAPGLLSLVVLSIDG